ncbi:MAG: DUF1553 domain-containing protein, partial [Pirellulaceae bacterium]
MQQERDKIVQQLPDFDRAYGATEGIPTNARLHRKGDPNQLGPEVPRGFLGALGGGRLPDGESGSGRRQLAEWLTSQAQSLTARVIVNRIWLHHFGRGLVRTPDDFGTRGERPTHPELLDYLARELVASGWSVKSLHRRILLSRIYRAACIERPEYQERDPDNRWLWTFLRRRLSAEEIRDAMYMVSGTLDLTRGAAHPFPAEWEWRYSQHRPFVDDYPSQRRSVYLMQQRIRQQPFLAIFDGADANTTTGLRKVSTVAPQALFMMNSELVHEQAAAFAQRLESDAATPGARLRLAYRLAFSRPPDASESREALAYLDDLQTDGGALDEVPPEERGKAAWASLLRVLLSSNEFLFVD